MSDAQRVIDEIDALVEEQLAGGEPEAGYDFDDPDFPECRCGLNWHGLPTLVCPGSDTEGPLQLPGLMRGWWTEVPSRESGLVFVDEAHQWPREGVEDTWRALAQATSQMRQQFAESWTRLVRAVGAYTDPFEFERFNLDQWVADHDWEAAVHEEIPSFAAQVQELATQPVPPPTPMWAVDVTRSRRGRQ